MNRNLQLFYIATALIAATPQVAEAATMVRTTTSSTVQNSAALVTISFADILNADQLLSISDGTVTAPEGGSFALAVNYAGGRSYPTFVTGAGFNFFYDLSALPVQNFPSGTVNGLTFSFPVTFGIPPSLNIPMGTSFSFHVRDPVTPAVPEPATWAMMLLGFGAIGAALRWRRLQALQVAG